MYIKFGKRLIDIIVSLIVLILSLPFLIFFSAIIWYDIGWPILFIQKRLGVQGNEFGLIKFKTIKGAIHCEYILSSADIEKRTSKIGKWIRLHYCDEIPQLWNVLLGHMSLVGPRPLMNIHYTNFSTPDEVLDKLLSVQPGLTGRGQITMRKQIYAENWIPEHDLEYINNLSFKTDLKIIVKTIPIVIRGH